MPPCLHIVAWFSAELLRDDVTKAKLKSAISQWYKCNNKIIMSHANESKFKQQQDNNGITYTAHYGLYVSISMYIGIVT